MAFEESGIPLNRLIVLDEMLPTGLVEPGSELETALGEVLVFIGKGEFLPEQRERLPIGFSTAEEIAIDFPVVEGFQLVFGGDEPAIDTILETAPGMLKVTVTGAARLRFPRAWLHPVVAEGDEWVDDPQHQFTEIHLGAGATLDQDWSVQLANTTSFNLPPAMVSDSGIVVESTGLDFNLSGAGTRPPGTPAGWKGVNLGEATVYLPHLPGARLRVSGLGLDQGGLSGVANASLTLDDIALGVDGLRVKRGLVQLSGLAFPLPATLDPAFTLVVDGELMLPVAGATVGMRAVLEPGAFTLAATGEAHLGNGIVLHPVKDANGQLLPVLAARVALGNTASAHFELHGGIDIPQDAGAPLRVELSGHLDLAMTAGAPAISSFAANSVLRSDWVLPGRLTLRQAFASIAFDAAAQRFTVKVGGAASLATGAELTGAAELDTTLVFNTADPHDVRLDGELEDVRLTLAGQLEIFDGTLQIALRTRPAAGESVLRLALTEGAGAMCRREGAAAGTPEAYFLSLSELAASFTLVPNGLDLLVTSGRVHLPPEFFSADPAADQPAISAGDPAHPLALRYRAPSDLSFTGSFAFADFGVRLPSLVTGEDVVARLDAATLLFDGSDRPALKGVSGSVTIPLREDSRAAIGFDDVEWDLAGLPTGEISLREELALPLGGEFVLALLPRETTPTARVPGTRLRVERSGQDTEFRFDAAVRLAIPESMLADVSGGVVRRVEAESSGWLVFSTAAGALPQIGISTISVGGDFRLGGADGLKITGARIDALGLEYLLERGGDAEHSLTLGLTGTIEFPNGGPRMGLDKARFIFDGAAMEDPPRFRVQGLRFTPGEAIADGLPLMVRDAGIHFDDENLELPALLNPQNLTLGLSLEVQVPMGEKAGLMARVDGVLVSIDDQGLPSVRLGGIGFGVEDLTIGNTILSGIVYLGGLQGFPVNPRDLFFVGKLGGTMSGTGIAALVGFKLDPPMPLGYCLDVDGGSAGIPLAQTGILFTGMSGGVSFANTNRSPCEFKSYIRYTPEGVPQSVDEMPEVEAPQPAGTETKSDNPIAAPGCPCSCPPTSMNVFCQPHPDRTLYPQRAIIKFSSLDEDFLRRLRVTLPGLGQVALSDLQTLPIGSPAEAAERAGALAHLIVRDGVVALWPDALGDIPQVFLDKLDLAEAELARRVRESLAQGGANRNLWEVIRDEAYRGLPCPDVTMEVTASLSYAGISSFVSITGGCSLSTTGAVGVIGWLNVVGIPVGKLKAFLVATSDQGDIDPAICGELTLSLGPLEFGKMNAQLDCRGLLTGLRDALLTTAADFGAPVVREALGILAPAVQRIAADGQRQTRRLIFETNYEDLDGPAALALLPQLHGGQVSALVAELMNAAIARATDPAEVQRLQACALLLMQRIWDAFEPKFVLCGKVAPKLFGMPMGGDVVSGTAFVTKYGMGAGCSFSPLYLLMWGINAATATVATLLSPLFAGLEAAVMGFALELPNPVQVMLDGANGQWRSPEDLETYLDEGMERLLANATLVAGYRLSPMGLTLTDSAARYLLPDFTDHPASPGRNPPWHSLADRDRIDLLERILATGRLADSSWNGHLDVLGMPGQYLGKHFFPHGGMLGASRIVVPRALLDAPPLDTFRLIFSDEPVLARLQAAMGYVTDYLLKGEQIGTFAFYAPAPNPPTFAVNGRNLSVKELLSTITDLAYREELLTGTYTPGPLWSVEESFLLGILQGRLLGVPVLDARMEFVPPRGAEEGYLEITAQVPTASWLHQWVSAEFSFRVRQAPLLPMDVQFRALAAALGIPLDGGAAGDVVDAALAAVPRSPEEALALLARIRAAVEEQLEQLTGNFLPASGLDAEREQRSARLDADLAPLGAHLQALALAVSQAPDAEQVLQVLLREVLASLARDLPKAALEVDVDLQLPAELAGLVGVSGRAAAKLFAYSPGYDPEPAMGGARGDAMRRGGIVATASLDLTLGSTAVAVRVDGTEIEVVPPAWPITVEVPRLLAQFGVADITLPGNIVLRETSIRLDSQPAAGGAVLTVTGAVAPIHISGVHIEPLVGDTLGASLQVFAGGRTKLMITPARLRVPVIGDGALMIHGATATEPFTFSTSGPWDAMLSAVGSVVVRNPLEPAGPVLLEVRDGNFSAALHCEGLASAQLAVRIAAGATVLAFPGQALEQSFTNASIAIDVGSDGRASIAVEGVRVDFPPAIADLVRLGANASLFACTPGYEPAATGGGNLARVRREGGIVLSGVVEFLLGAGATRLAVQGGRVELGIQPAPLPELPRIFSSVAIGDTPLPFAGLQLVAATASLDTQPGRWDPLLRVAGGLAPIWVGAFSIEPLAGDVLQASIEVDREGVATLRIAPARLALAGATLLRIHGDASYKPFTLFSDGGLEAGLSVEGGGMAITVPLPPLPPLLQLRAPGGPLRASLRGSLRFAELEIEVEAGADLSAFPGATFMQQWAGSGSISLLVNSDGRFALVVRGVANLTLPPELGGVVSLAAGAATRLVAYSPGYDPSAIGDSPLARIRREGGIGLRTSLSINAGPPGAAFSLNILQAELAVLAPSGDPLAPGALPAMPRLIGEFTLRSTLAENPWLGLRLRRGTLDTHPDAGQPFLSLAAEMPAIGLGGFTLTSAQDNGQPVLRSSLHIYPGGEIVVEIEPARLFHQLLAPGTRLRIHGAGTSDAPLRLSTTAPWTVVVDVEGAVLVQSPFDPDDPPLLRIEAGGITASLSGTGLLPTTLRITVPAATSVVAFPALPEPMVLPHLGFIVEAHADGSFLAEIDLPRLDFGALVIHGDLPAVGDEPQAPLKVKLSHYGFAVENARFRFEGLSEPSLGLRRFVIDGFGNFQATAEMRRIDITDFFHISSSSIHVEREGASARVSVHAPRLGLSLPWSPRLVPADDESSRNRLLPIGPDIDIDASGVFVYRHPEPVVVKLGGIRFSGTLEAGTRGAGLPEPYLQLTDVTLQLPFPGWSAPSARLVRLSPAGFAASLDAGTLGIPGVVEIRGNGWELDVVIGGEARFVLGSASIRLFDAFQWFTQAIDVRMAANGSYTLTLQAPAIDLLPGVLRLGGGSCTIRQSPGSAYLECSATLFTLPPITVRFSADAGGFRASFPQAHALFGIGDLLGVDLSPNSLVVKANPAGGFSVTQADLSATLFGMRRAFAPLSVAADGRVLLPWTGSVALPFGPLHPVSTDTSLGLNLLSSNRALALRLFGVAAKVDALPTNGYRLECDNNAWLTLVTSWLELGPAKWILTKQANGAATVDFTGQARMLKAGNRWMVLGTSAFSLDTASGAFSASIEGASLSLPAVSGRLGINASAGSFGFARAANGTWSASAALSLVVFGSTFNASASLAGNKATAALASSVPLGLMTVRPASAILAEADLSQGSAAGCKLTVPGGVIHFPDGWGLSDMPYEQVVLGGHQSNARIARTGSGADWQAVPNVPGVEFKLGSPTLKLDLDGTSVNLQLDAGPLEVRTTARSGNDPWGSAQSGTVSVTVGTDGTVPLPFPKLVNLRDSCKAIANGLATGGPREAQMVICNAIPDPPAMPDLAQAGAVALSSLITGWT